jgi:TorA maturation chaperone TorD
MQDILTNQEARVNIYALLSRLLMSEVDEELLKTIENDENIMAFFPSYAKWERRKEFSHKDLIEKYLNADFTNLFLLHMTPYESFYRREDQMMETAGDNPVLQLFNEHDFRVNLAKARTVSADHIGIELEFMYKLCDSELKALKDNELETAGAIAKIGQDFLKDHLLEWAPMFLINAKRESRTPLYHDGAEVTLEFLLSDFEYVTSMLNEYCQKEEASN